MLVKALENICDNGILGNIEEMYKIAKSTLKSYEQSQKEGKP